MNIVEVKKKYNYWLGRYLKAEEFINSSEPEEVDKYLGLFHQIVRELSLLFKRDISLVLFFVSTITTIQIMSDTSANPNDILLSFIFK